MNLGELIEKLQELELRHGDNLPVRVDHGADISDIVQEPTYICIEIE